MLKVVLLEVIAIPPPRVVDIQFLICKFSIVIGLRFKPFTLIPAPFSPPEFWIVRFEILIADSDKPPMRIPCPS